MSGPAPDSLLVGVDKSGGIGGIPGAGVHNYGYPEKNIAQREFLGLGERRLEEVNDKLTKACLSLVVGA